MWRCILSKRFLKWRHSCPLDLTILSHKYSLSLHLHVKLHLNATSALGRLSGVIHAKSRNAKWTREVRVNRKWNRCSLRHKKKRWNILNITGCWLCIFLYFLWFGFWYFLKGGCLLSFFFFCTPSHSHMSLILQSAACVIQEVTGAYRSVKGLFSFLFSFFCSTISPCSRLVSTPFPP